MSEADDDVKKQILSRRARFIAVALASVGGTVVSCSKPGVCLNVAPERRDSETSSASASAVPSTSAGSSEIAAPSSGEHAGDASADGATMPSDAASDAVSDSKPDTAGGPDVVVPPHPCLSPRPPPRPCLKIAPRNDD